MRIATTLCSAALYVLAACVGWFVLVLVVAGIIHGRAWLWERARETADALGASWRRRLTRRSPSSLDTPRAPRTRTSPPASR